MYPFSEMDNSKVIPLGYCATLKLRELPCLGTI